MPAIGLLVAGIFWFFQKKQMFTGELHFKNVGSLTKLERDRLRTEQMNKLVSPQVRTGAKGYLMARPSN